MKPKIVHVDFNDSMLGTIAREGEHNRTQLVFALDEDLQACDFINAEFGIEDSGEKLVLENLLPQEGENTLSVSLTQDVTVSGVLTIQLVGYVIDSETAEPRIIAKSPVVSGVVTPSINGIEKIAQGVTGLLDRILVKLNDLVKKAHEHKNKKTLDEFYCESLETGFETDASSTELKWRGKPIAFDFAGSKVSMVQEVEKEGRRYYRLWFTHGSFSVTNVPDYIDIPIDTLNKVTESNGNITLNGAELDLGLGAKAGGIKSVSALPTVANEGDVVYYCPPANTLTSADSYHKIYLNFDAIESLKKYGEDSTTANANLLWEYHLNESGDILSVEAGKYIGGQISAIIYYTKVTPEGDVTYLNVWNTQSGSFEFVEEESGIEIAGSFTNVTRPIMSFEIGEVDESYMLENSRLETGKAVAFPYFYVEPRFYRYTNGEWVEILTPEVDTSDIWTAIEEIRGGIDEIEALIDESGVLE